jgi:inosose dehydratase
MAPAYKLATAPCSWGVDFADRPDNPPWQRVLDEAAEAGFSAIDLGPVGFLPADPAVLERELAERGLSLSAGGLFDPLTDESAFPRIMNKTRRTCAILQALHAPRLVIIDCVSDTRGATAGRSGASKRLSADQWTATMSRIQQIAAIALNEFGVKSFLHPHAGSFIEYEDELDRAMDDLPSDLVGLCVDTGHSAYAGIDPTALIRRYAGRIGHLHLKNIDKNIYARCVAEHADFFTAVARGVFCPLGAGIVDFEDVRDALAAIAYTGVAVVEQDVDPAGEASPLANAAESLAFLRSVGMTAAGEAAS